jgi:hypothetical protein
VQWLAGLLRLGSRAKAVDMPSDDSWTGVLTMPVEKSFELPCSPPRAYLEALVRNARCRMPDLDEHPELCRKRSDSTISKRRDLRKGTRLVVDEALGHLAAGKTAPAWWVLEGTTMVDCALFAQHVTVFIEGKRTGPHVTGGVSWDEKRHQVFRNLDVLEIRPDRRDQFFVLLVVDEEYQTTLNEAAQLDEDPHIAFDSWPHRGPDEANALWSHYLGFTTWQEIVRTFGGLMLPNMREDSIASGLTVDSALERKANVGGKKVPDTS